MSAGASKARLTGITQQLSLQWTETKNHWRDARSHEFELRYMQELTAHVERALTVIDKLDVMLKKIRNDCE
jgi:hypothetical protein